MRLSFVLLLLSVTSLFADSTVVSCGDPNLYLSPYTWHITGSGTTSRAYANYTMVVSGSDIATAMSAEATLPGAYLRAAFSGSKSAGLIVDGLGNAGCSPSTMPSIEFTIDHGPLKTIQLSQTGKVYTLPLATDLTTAPHQLDLYFRSAGLGEKRWTTSRAHLRIEGISLDPGATALPVKLRPKLAIGYGDSITEGVGVESRFYSWNQITMNNALFTWFPIVASALDCEYGQLGSSGLGVVRPLELPGLLKSWDRYDANSSRLANGRLQPQPDYIFCCLGTNDPGIDLTVPYSKWLVAIRKAAPHAKIFCIVPPLGVHESELSRAVAAAHSSGDSQVYLINAGLASSFHPSKEGTAIAYDGVHPTAYGHALLAAHIIAAVEKILAH